MLNVKQGSCEYLVGLDEVVEPRSTDHVACALATMLALYEFFNQTFLRELILYLWIHLTKSLVCDARNE